MYIYIYIYICIHVFFWDPGLQLYDLLNLIDLIQSWDNIIPWESRDPWSHIEFPTSPRNKPILQCHVSSCDWKVGSQKSPLEV